MTREEREITIDYLEGMKEKYIEGEGYERHPLNEWFALDYAIKAIEQGSIIDKMRAELIQSIQNGTLKIESGNEELFRIIDKYKANKENEE